MGETGEGFPKYALYERATPQVRSGRGRSQKYCERVNFLAIELSHMRSLYYTFRGCTERQKEYSHELFGRISLQEVLPPVEVLRLLLEWLSA